jgi:ComF family protein
LDFAARTRATVTRLTHRLLPLHCLLCADPGADGLELCRPCHDALPWNASACATCALPLPRAAPRCGACLAAPPPYPRCHAPLRYGPPLDRLLPRFKFHAGLAEGRLLATLLLRSLPDDWPRADCVLPLPLHPQRLGRRGYNQALELARPLARALRVPLAPAALRRVRATAAQSTLDATARRGNVRGAFAAEVERLRGRHVWLVDDVITTAATVGEAAATLLAAGAREVSVLALARAPAPTGPR